MKKLIMLAAILALALAVAVPAIAQVSGGGGNSAESDEAALAFEAANEGDYASQCTPALQFGNTGNFNNAPTFLQYASQSDDFEPGASSSRSSPRWKSRASARSSSRPRPAAAKRLRLGF